jgi:multidrug efflux pump subunit AcrA (membrane-fusion protein)
MKNGLKYLLYTGIVFTYACSTNARIDDANGLESYFVYHPLVTDTTYFVDYISDITAIRNVEIRSRVKGFLEKIYIDEGQYVEKGQLLFAISNQEYQEELLVTRSNYKSAMAELRSAELDLKNTEKLFAGEVVSNTRCSWPGPG